MPPKKEKPFKHQGLISVKLFPAEQKSKKYTAVFYEDGVPFRKSSFGAKSYEDYTIHKDEERKASYLARHGATEEVLWETDPYAPATLSRYVLWNLPDLRDSWNDYKRRFNLQ
jgi:hypothetical protein